MNKKLCHLYRQRMRPIMERDLYRHDPNVTSERAKIEPPPPLPAPKTTRRSRKTRRNFGERISP